MNGNADSKSIDQRRKPRVTIPEQVVVLDAHNGTPLGHLVNLSEDGLMIVCPACVKPGTVLQLRIPLMKDGNTLELLVGAESLWCQDANDSGSFWTGFQIIDISPAHQEILDSVIKG